MFWTSITSVAIHTFLSFFILGSSLSYLIYLSLTLHFKQVHFDVEQSLKSNNFTRLVSVFKAHILMEKETKRINIEYKFYYLIAFKLFKFAFSPLINITHDPDTIPIIRLIVMIFDCLIVLSLIALFSSAVNVKRSAHKPISSLYHYMAQTDNRISLKMRMKMMLFIDRLSGPAIGFYCLNLFPITLYYFIDHIIEFGLNYLLLIDLLKKSVIIN